MAWFLAPYKVHPVKPQGRYCAMNDFNSLINADGGKWEDCVEILDPGIGRAIVKVVGASPATLATINAGTGFVRIPKDLFNDTLASLTNGQRTAIRNEILACGYTVAEVNARFPNLAENTVADVLRFMASRKRQPRWDTSTSAIVCDGTPESCESVDNLDARIT